MHLCHLRRCISLILIPPSGAAIASVGVMVGHLIGAGNPPVFHLGLALIQTRKQK